MHKKIFSWLGKEFVLLSGEAMPVTQISEETHNIFQRFDRELKSAGLSLENTVRTRLWGKDRESRNAGSDVRVKVLSGKARSASSSYISPGHFDSDARVALDLIALRPSSPDSLKQVREYEPPIVPVRFIVYDSVVFLSGVTTVLPTLEQQLDNILPRIEGSLRDAGSSWDRVARVSFYLHRSQTVQSLNEIFRKKVKSNTPSLEYVFVDGYSAEGKLVEIEVTATT
jgi:enamine deaminase RidA (YjgF/YER057c/UK114 family)